MDEQDFDRPRARDAEEPGLPPAKAFAVVCAIAAVAATAVFFATREASPSEAALPAASPARSPDYSLTDAEAIAEFKRLNAQLMRAYRTRDLSLIKTFAFPGSTFARTVEEEITSLLRDGVLDKTWVRSISEEVVSNTPSLIEVKQVAVERSRFLDARNGRDLTTTATQQRQTVVWTLELSDQRWLLSGATVTAAEARQR